MSLLSFSKKHYIGTQIDDFEIIRLSIPIDQNAYRKYSPYARDYGGILGGQWGTDTGGVYLFGGTVILGEHNL